VAVSPNKVSTFCDWPRRVGDSLYNFVNYCHDRLEISVITKLHEILENDGHIHALSTGVH
jgi:hypothetical protein